MIGLAKVKYFKDKCIGCMACTTVSKNWVPDNGKVKPVKTKVSGKETEENKEAERICPVEAIKVEE